jgi:pimeloyl-ACP methyl ester carboxylesterase
MRFWLILCVLLTPLIAQPVATDDFYDVPLTLTQYRDGDVIKSERVISMDSSLNRTIAHRIMYRSDDRAHRPIAVTGIIFEPRAGTPPPGGWPIISFAHGTTGVGDACAPSKYPNLYWNEYAWFVSTLVGDGFVVVATDYEGLGTPGLHPWLELESEALSGIDAVAATRQVVPDSSSSWAVVGHSQGGHAALGVGELARFREAKGLHFVGAVSMAPAASLSEFGAMLDSPDVGWDLLAYGAASIKASDPGFDYAEMLLPPLLLEMPRAEVTCDIELFQYFHNTYKKGVFGLRRDFLSNASVAAWIRRNEPAQGPSSGPILLVQGTNDQFLPVEVTQSLARRLCSNGDAVNYLLFNGADHDAVLHQAYDVVLAWLRDRFAGHPAISNCP